MKKENENPSVGIILCASKDDEVIEFALGRGLSPTMVVEYNLKLIDKKLLQRKLKEYIELAEMVSDGGKKDISNLIADFNDVFYNLLIVQIKQG